MLHILCHLLRKLGRTCLYCTARLVFILIIVEAFLRCNLYNRKSLSLDNADRELPALYKFLDNQLIFPLEGIVKCRLELCRILNDGDTDA